MRIVDDAMKQSHLSTVIVRLADGGREFEAYLPDKKVAIAVAATFAPAAFDDQGNYSNAAEALFRRIGAGSAPGHAPPVPPAK
jgi:chitinase